MSLRKHLERYQNFVAPALVILVIAVAAFAWKNSGTGHSGVVDTSWIYNLDTQELSALPVADAIAPLALDDGVGYRAFVYACGDCGDAEPEVAYLVKYTHDAADNTPNTERPPSTILEFVASLEMAQKNEWIAGNLGSKSRLMQDAIDTCPDRFQHCFP